MLVLQRVVYGVVVVLMPLVYSWGQQSSMQYDSAQSAIIEKEMATRELIAQEQAKIQSLKSQITETENKILRTISDQYEFLGITAAGVDQTADKLMKFSETLAPFLKLPSDSLLPRKAQIQALADQFEQLRSEPACRLSAFAPILSKTDQQLSELLSRGAKAEQAQLALDAANAQKTARDKTATAVKKSSIKTGKDPVSTYTIKSTTGERETLFKIAGYPEIYGNSSKWYRIYLANKDEIDKNYQKNATNGVRNKIIQPYDFLTPGQVLTIPR